jgi:hypothetical protein
MDAGGAKEGTGDKPVGRFLQFIRAHNQGGPQGSKLTAAAILSVRQIFNAKYISDRINTRMGHSLVRFPEFVVEFFTRDGDTLFSGLSKGARLWRAVDESKSPEIKLFKQFILEKLTVDELSFFIEARNSLIGQRNFTEDDAQIISVPYAKCREFVASVLGSFSPILTAVCQEAEKHAGNGYIDYAQFLTILVLYYQRERKMRRNAVKLMLQSKNIPQGEGMDFEAFVAMVQSLGFQGSNNEIFALYREANLQGGGALSTESVLRAMDSLSFHFYAIEVPMSMTKKLDMTQITRHTLMQHWKRFGAWFNAFRTPLPDFDPWVRARIIGHVKRVDQVFKTNAAISVLYSEYRQLLDFFQFALDVLARSQAEAMSAQKSERQLSLLENSVDLLITFIMKDCGGEILFTESI